MRKRIVVFSVILIILFAGVRWAPSFLASRMEFGKSVYFFKPKQVLWEVQSIDTMKYSRDLAEEKLNDANFGAEVDRQVSAIAKTGATHVAVSTPYDEKFIPFLKIWVDATRKNNLNVWFRGNWSAWEGWFGSPKNMTRQEHIEKTERFILENSSLFSNGDIFSSCPECENGGPGDPRHNGDLAGHRKFIVDEYASAKKAFESIEKNVKANYFSMNGDVARLVMDRETTEKLDGLVAIDHYVSTPEKLVADIAEISKQSGGRVVLGEWGVPIPDIHGEMTEDQKVEWMRKALNGMIELGDILEGINYWAAYGGSSALWEKGEETSKTSDLLHKYYFPQLVYGRVVDEIGRSISGARILIVGHEIISGSDGYFEWRSAEKTDTLDVSAGGYISARVDVSETVGQTDISLKREQKSVFFRMMLWIKNIIKL